MPDAAVVLLLGLRDDELLIVAFIDKEVCHSPLSPSSRRGALSEASPERRRFMSMTSCSSTPSLTAICFT